MQGGTVNRSKYMILGGGMVAGYAAKELVERGLKSGELTILSADNAIPYERPPLSKSFLAGKDDEKSIRINAEEFYGQHGIEVKLGCEVAGVDARQKTLHLQSGEDLDFEKLIVATGAQVKTLDVPGGNLGDVYYLRSMEDSKKIRTRAGNAKRAAVIGGGFIAMEVSAVLAQKGIETTMLIREDRIWKQVFTPAMSRFFEDYYSARGVRLIKQTNLTELKGDSAVKSVALQGGQTVGCDMVVAGIGVSPVTEPVANSGMQIANGVVVNEYLETSVPGIHAAGDVANYQDTLFNMRRRVEHWDNAVSQGQHCARALSGERAAFIHVPYFFSDVFDLSYEFWGDPANADQIVERGDLSTSSFSVWWLHQRRVIAAFVMSRPDEERDAATKWIESKQQISAEKLKNKSSVFDAPESAS
jgi:NADPH-dependent 2,4-dienoyl-CoA reductase/sulfur reductase-like enzyme